MASSRMPRLMAWVASVCRSRCGCTPGHAGGTADAGDDAADDIPVQRAAVVGDQPAAAPAGAGVAGLAELAIMPAGPGPVTGAWLAGRAAADRTRARPAGRPPVWPGAACRRPR